MLPPPPDRPTALVVEDDDHMAHLLDFMLQRAGYRVVRASDGRAASEIVRTRPAPAVALVDMMLPFHDGMHLVGLVRRQPGWEHVPVIMLTSRSREADIVGALDAGANDYIVKPFQPEELLARLRRCVRAASRP